MLKMKEKVAMWIGVATFTLALVSGHVTTQVEIARVTERVDNLQQTNQQTLEVLNRLAESVDRLSVSVARLEERTGSLERQQY